ncbi:KEOPS complex subunit Pcc1 [Halobacterium wangiae]|uniref:KEOPS complex subunit Pcc1 n=1 Tax=Halobacterium wangiae TaxID=2902623 RepID=UPI001E45F82B|nr:KEOPS complex subunit Pcc1 [Halobacterium wangiae]
MTRTATVRTDVADPEVVARSVRPDNTTEMETRVERDGADDGTVVTRIERDDTAGLASTLDDYVVNVTVATEVAQHAERHTTTQS